MRLFLLAILLLLALTSCVSIKHLEGEAAADGADATGDDTAVDGGDIDPTDLPDASTLTREELEAFYSIIVDSIKNGPSDSDDAGSDDAGSDDATA